MSWEYRIKTVVPGRDDEEALLNDFGKAGWELITVIVEPYYRRLYFKRPAT